MAGGVPLGYLYADIEGASGRFGRAERELIAALADAAAATLDRDSVAERLVRELAERGAELARRTGELAVIDRIQQGVSAALDFQAIVDLVGDKLREVLETGDLIITWRDEATGTRRILYSCEHGVQEQSAVAPGPARPPDRHRPAAAQPVVVRNQAEGEALALFHFAGTDMSLSSVFVPMFSGDRFLGTVILENYERENAFGEAEVRLLSTVAAGMGAALENARLFAETQRLLKETEQRNAELAVINSVQSALAAELSIQGIYEAVGDKVQEIFRGADVQIRIFDQESQRVEVPYALEEGRRLSIAPIDLKVNSGGFGPHVFRTGQSLLIKENMAGESARYGSYSIGGSGPLMKSLLMVPMVVGTAVRGLIGLSDQHREHAFDEGDLRLLQTLSGSMAVALENARLFAETQRLLKETEQRNAELAVINSVQSALAAELSMQGIYEAVGDKIQEIFRGVDVEIRIFDGESQRVDFPYVLEEGKRLSIASIVLKAESSGFGPHVFRTGETLLSTTRWPRNRPATAAS